MQKKIRIFAERMACRCNSPTSYKLYNMLMHNILPPPVANSDISNALPFQRCHALLHSFFVRVGRASLCFPLLFLPFFLSSCDQEEPRYAEMVEYHAESCHLPSASVDSIGRFSGKVKAFVAQHPAAKKDPLYPEIVQNIRQSLFRFQLIVVDEWEDEIDVKF